MKDPQTGKRQARLNPPEAWVIEEVPELRIVEDALWQRVKERQDAIRKEMNAAGIQGAARRPERARRPVYLFSGLFACGCCGAGYTLVNKSRHGCAAARDKGAAVSTTAPLSCGRKSRRAS
ncbi:zinc ribbon domain-containing protein [Paracoccus sp. (in: a-proteobacteria)]|uniref:zinc ribbon domain-containing protein n=1 Tax=Paracoccus sp. TaxID=267 RepID=UPI00396C6CA4